LTTGEVVYHRVREFEYRDITSLSLDATGSPKAVSGRRGRRMAGLLRLGGSKLSSNYKASFSIGLPADAGIVALVYDGRSLSEMRDFAGVADSELKPLTDWDHLRKIWKRLSELKRDASGRS
jgi:hypothetical protein